MQTFALAYRCNASRRYHEGLPLTSLAPDDSFLRPYFETRETVFDGQVGIAGSIHFQGFDHSAPEMQARILAAWGIQLGSRFIVDIDPKGGGNGASSPSNWLTVTLNKGSALNHTLPCRDLGVSPELCKLAAVPFFGVEPRLLPVRRFAGQDPTSFEIGLNATRGLEEKEDTSSSTHIINVCMVICIGAVCDPHFCLHLRHNLDEDLLWLKLTFIIMNPKHASLSTYPADYLCCSAMGS